MSFEDKFYLLIVDEVRAQPGFVDQLDTRIKPARKLLNVLGRMAPLLGPVGTPDIVVQAAGLAPRFAEALGPAPIDLSAELTSWQSTLDGDNDATYMALCRSALLHLLYRQYGKAEEAVNLAKFEHDNWAFAHYVYGLLRGVQGDAGKAHFELYLAAHREPYPEARERIERALDLVR